MRKAPQAKDQRKIAEQVKKTRRWTRGASNGGDFALFGSLAVLISITD